MVKSKGGNKGEGVVRITEGEGVVRSKGGGGRGEK